MGHHRDATGRLDQFKHEIAGQSFFAHECRRIVTDEPIKRFIYIFYHTGLDQCTRYMRSTGSGLSDLGHNLRNGEGNADLVEALDNLMDTGVALLSELVKGLNQGDITRVNSVTQNVQTAADFASLRCLGADFNTGDEGRA
jgi:hypothetical protein